MTKVIPITAARGSKRREEVASFAAWCVGSCAPQGDWGPEGPAEYRRVLQDDAAYANWAREYDDFERERRGNDGPSAA